VLAMELKTMEEMLKDERIDRDLLWAFPYDGLKLWVRIWRHALEQHMSLRRYEQSPTLALMKKRLGQEIDLLKSHAIALRGLAESKIEEIVKELPEWQEWARHVPGVGAFSLGKFLGYVGNPAARHLFSSFARHCGLAPVDGRIEKPQKGQRRTYNPLAKSQLYLVVKQVIMAYQKTPNLYGEFYYLSKKKFERSHPEWTKMHRHLAAILRTARLFLSHLWEVCRRTQGLPVRGPYPIEYENHVVKIPAEMALHPVKRRDEVLDAIKEVMIWLPDEPDELVRGEVEELVEKLRRVTQMAKKRKRA
jgi:hypothetical protein